MPSFEIEENYDGIVVGVDEAGRGPWVGPVVAGAVVFVSRDINPYLFENLNDSKKISEKKREELYKVLREEEVKGRLFIGIGEASSKEIDEHNILKATFMAMERAVKSLNTNVDMAVLDGNQCPKNFVCPTKSVIKGDGKSYSIAAASIVAKVYRDRLLKEMALKYPQYGFDKNAGYGTKEHINALKKHGITPEHRMSYKPIKALLEE